MKVFPYEKGIEISSGIGFVTITRNAEAMFVFSQLWTYSCNTPSVPCTS